jgi:hypothetical protein
MAEDWAKAPNPESERYGNVRRPLWISFQIDRSARRT